MSEYLRVTAYAKINLLLQVLGKRSDGYHELNTIMQSVGLADQLLLQRQATGIEIVCSDALLPRDQGNLVWQAFAALQQYCNLQSGIRIELVKHIPAAAGLAGGSADAAAVLLGADRLFNLGLSHRELLQLAAAIGSDVAFCLRGGTALAQGRGEIITQLADLPLLWLVLVNPGFAVSTGLIFDAVDNFSKVQAAETGQQKQLLTDNMSDALQYQDISRICEHIANDLQPVTMALYPQLQTIENLLQSQQLLSVFMSGSGPTFVGLAEDKEKALTAHRAAKARGLWSAVVPVVTEGLVLLS